MDYQMMFWALLPDLMVVVGLFAALGLDYGLLRHRPLPERNFTLARLASWSLVLGLVTMVFLGMQVSDFHFADGQIVFTPMRYALKAGLFAMAILVVQLSAREPVTGQASEYYALLLLATLGMGFVITSGNLLGAFVSLELVSLSLYALTGLWRRSRPAAESAMKYFVFGAVSSAFLLFGLSYIYGVTGALDMAAVADRIAGFKTVPPMLVVGWLLLLVGLGFKIAAAPFHAWAPDVYHNAPTPAAAWVATGSKIAAIALMITLFQPVIDAPEGSPLRLPLGVALAALAVTAMVGGNLAALRQTNLKRLLAYSAIANSGYLLVGLIALTNDARAATLFYTLVYALSTLGAFAVVSLVGGRLGRDAEIDDFRGCWKTMPGMAALMLIFILSLAGIPPLAGFVGKYYLFYAAILGNPDISAWNEGWYWLVGIALLMSVVSLYYYLKVLKAFLVHEGDERAIEEVGTTVNVALLLLAFTIVALGLYPQPILDIFIAAGG